MGREFAAAWQNMARENAPASLRGIPGEPVAEIVPNTSQSEITTATRCRASPSAVRSCLLLPRLVLSVRSLPCNAFRHKPLSDSSSSNPEYLFPSTGLVELLK